MSGLGSDERADKIVELDFTGTRPGFCGVCRRDFDPAEPVVFFGWHRGYPYRAGTCCADLLDRIVIREVRQ